MGLAEDPQIRAVVETARAWGISPKRLLGWEPEHVTVYEYDDAGRVTRTTTTIEPEWDDKQRELAFALQAYEADLCPGCKQPLTETTRVENEGQYEPGPAVRCHRCTAADQAFKKYQDSPAPQALFLPVRLRNGSTNPEVQPT